MTDDTRYNHPAIEMTEVIGPRDKKSEIYLRRSPGDYHGNNNNKGKDDDNDAIITSTITKTTTLHICTL